MAFNVGDIVWCTSSDVYDITNYHVKCKVIRPLETGVGINMVVKTLTGGYIKKEFRVNTKYFELVKKPIKNWRKHYDKIQNR